MCMRVHVHLCLPAGRAGSVITVVSRFCFWPSQLSNSVSPVSWLNSAIFVYSPICYLKRCNVLPSFAPKPGVYAYVYHASPHSLSPSASVCACVRTFVRVYSAYSSGTQIREYNTHTHALTSFNTVTGIRGYKSKRTSVLAPVRSEARTGLSGRVNLLKVKQRLTAGVMNSTSSRLVAFRIK